MSWLREPDAEPIPGYRLIEPLGSGGFGEVWKCVAPGDIFKAIKFVYGNLYSEDGDAVRAEQEHKAMQRVKEVRHPFVLSTERIDIIFGGELAIVMELADKSLHDCFLECQSFRLPGIPRADLIRYLQDAADGLDHLIEKHNLQHLDVKPRNLFLIGDRVKVADFGLVKHLERQSSAGMGGVTPLYAAPETFSGKISKHSDQYSLAVVYVELLTGRRPFSGKNVRQVALQHMNEPPDLSGLPEGDRPVLARALAKDPAKRFPSCLAFMRSLTPAAVTVPVIDLGPAADAEPDLGRTQIVGDLKLPHADQPAAEQTPRLDKHALPVRIRPVSPQVAPAVDVSLPAEPVYPAPPVSDGVLRPTVVIGIGAFGRRTLVELRCRLLDRFGDLHEIPSFRFLYVDSDPEATEKATAGTPEVVLDTADVFPLPLQPVANYRRRMLDHVSEWLPREKLHSIPRSLQPQGSRALGRLAFLDNYLRFQSRLRRELQVATRPDSLTASSAQTGLEPGDPRPRVFVIAAAGGGSSGMLADLGYSVRRLLTQLNYPDAPVTALVYCGAPNDPATPRQEQANLFATLTELNHFADPGVSFQCQYGPDGPRIHDAGPPFHSVYLTQLPQRGPEALRDCIAQVATYLCHDLSTPLGPELERYRHAPPAVDQVPFRGFGTFSAWYPRGLLLRVAARRACGRLLDIWQTAGADDDAHTIETACTKAVADPGLRWERLAAELNEAANTAAEGSPLEATERYLASLEAQADQAATLDDPGTWATQTLERVHEWAGVGTGRDLDSVWTKSRFYRALGKASQQVAEAWEQKLSEQVLPAQQLPGHRLAAAEQALGRLAQFCAKAVAAQWQSIDRHFESTRPVRDGLRAAANDCRSGFGFKLFGGGSTRALRQFAGMLGQFARGRIAQDLLEAGVQFYQTLQGRLEDRIRDVNFCRQQVRNLRKILGTSLESVGPASPFDDHNPNVSPATLADPFWDAVQGSSQVRVVLPAGVRDLEQSADQFVESLRPDHWLGLDESLQAEVLAPLGDLLDACSGSTDLLRHLGRPLIEQAAAFLGTILPITDVAQVEYSASRAENDAVADHVRDYQAAAVPPVGGSEPDRQRSHLLIPDTEAGQALGREAQAAMPGLKLIPVGSPTELTFCREHDCLSVAELQQLLGPCRKAYRELAPVPAISPHARFDVLEWIPLDP